MSKLYNSPTGVILVWDLVTAAAVKASFSYSSSYSVTPCAQWMGGYIADFPINLSPTVSYLLQIHLQTNTLGKHIHYVIMSKRKSSIMCSFNDSDCYTLTDLLLTPCGKITFYFSHVSSSSISYCDRFLSRPLCGYIPLAASRTGGSRTYRNVCSGLLTVSWNYCWNFFF